MHKPDNIEEDTENWHDIKDNGEDEEEEFHASLGPIRSMLLKVCLHFTHAHAQTMLTG